MDMQRRAGGGSRFGFCWWIVRAPATVTLTISIAGLNIDGARVATTQDQKAISTFDLW